MVTAVGDDQLRFNKFEYAVRVSELDIDSINKGFDSAFLSLYSTLRNSFSSVQINQPSGFQLETAKKAGLKADRFLQIIIILEIYGLKNIVEILFGSRGFSKNIYPKFRNNLEAGASRSHQKIRLTMRCQACDFTKHPNNHIYFQRRFIREFMNLGTLQKLCCLMWIKLHLALLSIRKLFAYGKNHSNQRFRNFSVSMAKKIVSF
ncbi:hypothetical protein Bca4012_044851 [Brassica carinata]